MRLADLALACLVTSCAYRSGSFDSLDAPFAGQRARASCLDLAIERRADLGGDPVLAYSFGNRCDSPELVDLASVAVVDRSDDAWPVQLAAYDPERVIEARMLDGRAVGFEAISYVACAPVDDLCVDAASIARAGPPSWLCFASDDRSAR